MLLLSSDVASSDADADLDAAADYAAASLLSTGRRRLCVCTSPAAAAAAACPPCDPCDRRWHSAPDRNEMKPTYLSTLTAGLAAGFLGPRSPTPTRLHRQEKILAARRSYSVADDAAINRT